MNRRQIIASCCAFLGTAASVGAKDASHAAEKPLLSKNSTRSEAAELARGMGKHGGPERPAATPTTSYRPSGMP